MKHGCDFVDRAAIITDKGAEPTPDFHGDKLWFGLPRRLRALCVMLKACAECPYDFGAGFAKRLELGFVYPLDIFAEMIGNLRELTFNVFTVKTGIGRSFIGRFHAST